MLHVWLGALVSLSALECGVQVENERLSRQCICHNILCIIFCYVVCLHEGWQVLNSPNGKTVEAIVVVRGIDTTRIEVQVVAVGG